MFANQLGQTLLVESATPFSTIEKVMAELGWMRENQSPDGSSLISGEPEFATWSQNGMKPFVLLIRLSRCEFWMSQPCHQ